MTDQPTPPARQFEVQRYLPIIVLAIAGFVFYQFWVRSGVFDGLFWPQPDQSGKVSVSAQSTATFLSSAMEIVAWIGTTILSGVGWAVFQGSRLGVRFLGPYFGDQPQNNFQPMPGPGPQPSPAVDPRLQPLIIESLLTSIQEGDKQLTIIFAHKLHGKPFLTSKSEPKTDVKPEGE